ncbi:MAG: response regulator [Thermoplasmata archaeon]|nr:response regulator [Thermoplasmata archaeon]
MRLLVVDDDAVFRQELADLLEQDGHEVGIAPSVPRALEALAVDPPDLVFTDLKMPRHSGLELLREVRGRWPRTLVVMITGFATVDTAVDAMKMGAFDYIQKPFRIDQVQKTLALAAREIRFQGRGEPSAHLEAIVRRWTEEGLEVLRVRHGPAPPQKGVTVFDSPAEASLVRDGVESFLPNHPKPGILIEGVDRYFDGDARAGLVRFVRSIRETLGERGPLVVTFDPAKISAAEGEELQAALAGPATRSTMEALSNPIRRSVLQRAGEGPISFTQALQAAGLDDSPKLAFHLRRLVDEGLLGHLGDEYRISHRGEETLHLLARWDSLAASAPSASAALPMSPASEKASGPASP